MRFSSFGEKFTGHTGILQLMDDLGNAAAGGNDVIMLGGGNPSHIPSVEQVFRQRMVDILQNGDEFEHLIGDYDPPGGNPGFREDVAGLLNELYGWQVTASNIALTNGSQTAFFYLFNMFGGKNAKGEKKRILLPLAPEYIGYVDAGIEENMFVANKPQFQFLDEHTFKYRVDFDAIHIDESINAICVSRPTNPTGNVLTDKEIDKLRALAHRHDIPLIIDNAYGAPFPGIIFEEVTPVWDEQIILCLSLSKLGLPGVRTGIIVANERIASAISSLNAIVSLAPTSVGAGMVQEMVRSGDIISISREQIMPYYRDLAQTAEEWVWESMGGTPFYLHKPEGAFFFWLWFKDLPISCGELYNRLKRQGVVVVPGQYFYPGLAEPWDHKGQCIRMNYTAGEENVREGIRIIGEEIKRAYTTG